MANQNFKVKKGLEVGTALTATSDGLNVTGVVTATQFSGDGSGLTGITAAGSGVVVQEEGSNVGTAATINFIGSNVTAAISSGIANVTISAGGLSNVVEDTTPQLGGNLDLNNKNITGTGSIAITGGFNATGVSTFQESVTFQSHASFGDNDKANFGAGNDIQIYHNGTNSFIDNTTGSLYIRGANGNHVRIQSPSGEESIVAAANGSVDLYYDNAKKLETTNTGITVTGAVSATTFSGAGSGLTDVDADNASNLLVSNQTGNAARVITFAGTSAGGVNAAVFGNANFTYNPSTTELKVGSGVTINSTGVTVTGTTSSTQLIVSGISSTGTIHVGHTTSTQGSGSIIKANEINLTGPNSTDSNSTFYSNIRLNKVGGGFKYDLEFHSNGYSSGDIGDFIFYKRGTSSQRTERMRLSGETGQLTVTGGGSFAGVVTATSYSGSGSSLTGLTGASAGTYGASTNTPIITVDSNGRITGITTVATAGAGGGGGISNIVEDTTPQLGGNLDLNSKDITGSGDLDYTGNLKVTGISTITGVAGFSSHITLADHAEIQVGSATGGDLKIYHNGSDSFIQDVGTGVLAIAGSEVRIQNAGGNENCAKFIPDGAVELYHNNALRLKTTGTGVNITDDLNVAGVSTFQGNVQLLDNDKLLIGGSLGSHDGLEIYHTGSHSLIDESGTGNLVIRSNLISFEKYTNEQLARFTADGSCEFYYDNSKKFETTSSGATVTGALTATTIVKSGGSSSQFLMADGSVSTTVGISTNSNNIQATWSVTANGASAYRFSGPGNDGADDNPDLYLVRGQRYRFTNNSGGSHPFQIRSVVGGSAYSAGVTNNGAASGNIEFNVQHDAPSRLFYQCTAHSGMVGNIYITGGGQWENTSVAASGTPEIYTDYNVGIGTDNPYAKNHIEIDVNAGAGSGSAAALWLKNANQTANNSATIFFGNNVSQAAGAINFIHKDYSTNAGDITFDTRANGSTYAERLRITSDGKMGVGCTPETDFQVRNGNGGTVKIGGSGSGATGFQIQYNNSGSTTTELLTNYRSTNGSASLKIDTGTFLVATGTGGTEKLRITADGKTSLGGTFTPGATLHVRDSNNTTKGAAQLKISKGVGSNAAPTSISRADCYIHLGGSEWGANGTGIYLMGLGYTNGETGSGIPAYIGYRETTSSGYTLGDLVFGTRGNTTGTNNPTERLRITSDGRLLVGGSTSARSTFFNSSSWTPQVQIENTSDQKSSLSLICSHATNNQAGLLALGATKSSSLGGNGLTGSSQGLGIITFQGNDGSQMVEAARIACVAAGSPSADNMPGSLRFSVNSGSSGAEEKMRITSSGFLQLAGNNGVVTGDNEHIFRQGQTSYNVLQLRAESNSYAASGGGAFSIGVTRSASSSYSFAGWYSGNGSTPFSDREYNFRGDGHPFSDGSSFSNGADYAEYFEWSDGNPTNEDRRGLCVVLDGDKIREAAAGEDPIGVVSGNPSVVGDSAWNKWKDKYLRDEYGSYLLDENGERQLNPDYDPDTEYTSREDRPEWDIVGLMGKIRIRTGQVTGSRWIKMRDISANIQQWLVR